MWLAAWLLSFFFSSVASESQEELNINPRFGPWDYRSAGDFREYLLFLFSSQAEYRVGLLLGGWVSRIRTKLASTSRLWDFIGAQVLLLLEELVFVCSMMMAFQVVADLVGLVWRHPMVSCLVLVLFTPPFFPLIKYFSPLLISTGLFILLLVTMGPGKSLSSSSSTTPLGEGEEFELRRVTTPKVWKDDRSLYTEEEEVDENGGRTFKRRKADGWMDWVKEIEESGLAWVEKKLKNENWKGSTLNDENVSILQEAFSDKTHPVSTIPETKPSTRQEASTSSSSSLQAQPSVAKEVILPFSDALDLINPQAGTIGEVAPLKEEIEFGEGGEQRDQVAPVLVTPHPVRATESSSNVGGGGVHHLGVVPIQIPLKAATTGDGGAEPSPDTELDDTPSEFRQRMMSASLVRRDSMNANSGKSVSSVESDLDSPAAQVKLSKSGKLHLIESLGNLIEEQEHEVHEHGKKSPVLQALKPTAADELQDVKDKLEHFLLEEHKDVAVVASLPPAAAVGVQEKSLPELAGKTSSSKPGSPLFKATPVASAAEKKKLKVRNEFSSDDESSGDEQFSESDSDSEFEIFPPVEPHKMKLHPPVKLDIQQIEKRLGTPLQESPPTTSKAPGGSGGGEISEVHQGL